MKRYTAGEMRQMAGYIEYKRSVQHFSDIKKISAMLRQAAVSLERGKYEYGVRYCNIIDRERIFESEEYARMVAGDSLQVVRREVSEWEEVANEE